MLIRQINKKCMLCHYRYFSYRSYLCNDCYNTMQKSINFKKIAIVHIKKCM